MSLVSCQKPLENTNRKLAFITDLILLLSFHLRKIVFSCKDCPTFILQNRKIWKNYLILTILTIIIIISSFMVIRALIFWMWNALVIWFFCTTFARAIMVSLSGATRFQLSYVVFIVEYSSFTGIFKRFFRNLEFWKCVFYSIFNFFLKIQVQKQPPEVFYNKRCF